jgi:hypothetical protein
VVQQRAQLVSRFTKPLINQSQEAFINLFPDVPQEQVVTVTGMLNDKKEYKHTLRQGSSS